MLDAQVQRDISQTKAYSNLGVQYYLTLSPGWLGSVVETPHHTEVQDRFNVNVDLGVDIFLLIISKRRW